MHRRYLVWLAWPYGAFRLSERSQADLERRIREGDSIEVVWSEREFLDGLPLATHAIVWNFEREWFSLAPNLKVLATPGAGRELLPTDGEMPKGVKRVNGSFHGTIMSESVIAFIFAQARGLYAAYDFQRGLAPLGGGAVPEGRQMLWPRCEMSPYSSLVAGTSAVIVGYGRIGKVCGAKLEALGVRVKGFSRANINDLDKALESADWVILALPGDTGTDNLLNAARIARLKKTAVVINVGRGNSIDEIALREALEKGHIKAAFLDVFKTEPLTEESPLVGDIPHLYRFPHSSAFAPEYLPLFWDELEGKGFFG